MFRTQLATPLQGQDVLRVVERYGNERHRLIQGDALSVTAQLEGEGLTGKVDLVYVDPPFLSQTDYIKETRLDGHADGRIIRSVAYGDRWGKKDGGAGSYLDMLAPRLEALTRLLSARGSIWVHLDWRAAYLVRVLLDEIMGRDAFMNEVVWKRAPNLGRQARSGQFGRTLDTIVVYGGKDAVLVPPLRKEPIEQGAIRTDDQGRYFTSAPRGDYTDDSIAKLDKIGRVHRTASGKVYIKYFLVQDNEGRWCRERPVDTLWTDIAPIRHAAKDERTGYPTQKPRALLERIIECATPQDGLVLDVFAGSGTTAEAAHVKGRRAIVSDAQAGAIATARARFIRANMGFSVATLTVKHARDTPVSPSEPAPMVTARATSRALLDGSQEITLEQPKEPLSWAVGAVHEDGAFTATVARARVPGKKPAPSDVTLALPALNTASAVRVHTDDGHVLTTLLENAR
jgi:DNA modification methylase